MYKAIKKYQKKLLAIFAVLLMIAFIATLGPGGPGSGRGRSDVVVAHVGKEPVYERELQAAKDQWQVLMRTGVSTQQSFEQQLPVPYAAVRAGRLPMSVVQDIEKHPAMFLLLQRDAEQRGVSVSVDEAKTFWVNQLRRPAETLNEVDVRAVRGLLTLIGSYEQLAESVKVSQPVWQHEAAQQFQGVKLNLVDFRAEDFEKSVPAPTAEQLREHFDKYKNVPPRGADSLVSDGLGFGYQIPARVKVQYVAIPHAKVAESLQPTPEKRHDWEVKAAEYYLAHEDEFRNPATQPTTAPATQAATTGPTTQSASAIAPASQPAVAAASQPAIKPFDEVKQQIVEKLMAGDVAKQMDLIEKELVSQLSADWVAIRKEHPAATQPATTQSASPLVAATQPAGEGGAATRPAAEDARMTLARLEEIRADIRKKYNVLPDLHAVDDWQDARQLAALPGIGEAATRDRDRFADYALTFTGRAALVSAAPLQVWESSQALTDAQQNRYVFRLTAAEPPHAPPDVAPLLAQLTADWRQARAYELAKQAAQKLADSAKSAGLAQAARTAGLQVISTGQFSPRNPRMIPGYTLTDAAAQQDLGQAAQKLLKDASQADPHPASLVELPAVRRVAVAELAAAQLELPEWFAQIEIVNGQRQTNMQKLAQDWFGYDAVVSRLDYKSEEKAGG